MPGRRDRSRQLIGSRAGKSPRNCLCCGSRFMSQGAHNRLCAVCRGEGGDMTLDLPGWRR